MDIKSIERIRTLSVIAMVSDDELMDLLVLKGGNAIDLIYKISERASIDVDFSMQNEFKAEELKTIKAKVEEVLIKTFDTEGLKAFDITFAEKPKVLDSRLKKFWGGYKIGFKVIPKELYEKNPGNINFLRRTATVIGPGQKRIFEIDVSKFEYCREKQQKELEGYTVYVYTPEMIVFEKIRAICQQIPEYKEIIKTMTRTPRARDFFDIYILIEKFSITLNSKENQELLKNIFEAKKVPLAFLKELKNYKEFHRQDFSSLRDTVRPDVDLKDFDFYFNYVIKKFENMKF